MIPRYRNERIAQIWDNENKLKLWQETELSVVRARANLGRLEKGVLDEMTRCLQANPIDISWWLNRDGEIGHDLQAFLDERLRFLPPALQRHFHDGLTSYDTEEPAFAGMLQASLAVLCEEFGSLRGALAKMARRYRSTVMNGRTHGQEAEPQSFGKRCITWLAAFNASAANLESTRVNLGYSKLSGAVGNHSGLDPDLERKALEILGFRPWLGATQIMPRELYAPTAQALSQVVLTLHKIAHDIRLGARSGRPIYQEPFGRKQTGSSRMPHKKNTIATEQLEGMARMAKGFFAMIMENIVTWEERAIEQSSVERVAWPGLFHVTVHALKTMIRVLRGLQVYPDHMMTEVVDSCGCYASGKAKEFLRHHGAAAGLTTEEAYRIVQLAAFNAFEPDEWQKGMRENPPASLQEADAAFMHSRRKPEPTSIELLIPEGRLRLSSQLEASYDDVQRWNEVLCQLFSDASLRQQWSLLFVPSSFLENEESLFREILG